MPIFSSSDLFTIKLRLSLFVVDLKKCCKPICFKKNELKEKHLNDIFISFNKNLHNLNITKILPATQNHLNAFLNFGIIRLNNSLNG